MDVFHTKPKTNKMKRRHDEIRYIESKKIKVNTKFKCVLPRILMYIQVNKCVKSCEILELLEIDRAYLLEIMKNGFLSRNGISTSIINGVIYYNYV